MNAVVRGVLVLGLLLEVSAYAWGRWGDKFWGSQKRSTDVAALCWWLGVGWCLIVAVQTWI